MRVVAYKKGSGSIKNIINDVLIVQRIERQMYMVVYKFSSNEIQMKTFSTKEFDIEVEFTK